MTFLSEFRCGATKHRFILVGIKKLLVGLGSFYSESNETRGGRGGGGAQTKRGGKRKQSLKTERNGGEMGILGCKPGVFLPVLCHFGVIRVILVFFKGVCEVGPPFAAFFLLLLPSRRRHFVGRGFPAAPPPPFCVRRACAVAPPQCYIRVLRPHSLLWGSGPAFISRGALGGEGGI